MRQLQRQLLQQWERQVVWAQRMLAAGCSLLLGLA
jgi:hypothetical protein